MALAGAANPEVSSPSLCVRISCRRSCALLPSLGNRFIATLFLPRRAKQSVCDNGSPHVQAAHHPIGGFVALLQL